MQFNKSFERRFWAKVNKTADCWLWTASTAKPNGYGQIAVDQYGTMIRAHRASYILHFGDIPNNLLVCHKCDNHLCVHPDHLFLGTCADNHADRNRKNRTACGIKSGNVKLTEDQVLAIRSSSELQRVLAKRYNVSQRTVSLIITRLTWKH